MPSAGQPIRTPDTKIRARLGRGRATRSIQQGAAWCHRFQIGEILAEDRLVEALESNANAGHAAFNPIEHGLQDVAVLQQATVGKLQQSPPHAIARLPRCVMAPAPCPRASSVRDDILTQRGQPDPRDEPLGRAAHAAVRELRRHARLKNAAAPRGGARKAEPLYGPGPPARQLVATGSADRARPVVAGASI